MCKVSCIQCKHFKNATDAGRKLAHGRCQAKKMFRYQSDPVCKKYFELKEY